MEVGGEGALSHHVCRNRSAGKLGARGCAARSERAHTQEKRVRFEGLVRGIRVFLHASHQQRMRLRDACVCGSAWGLLVANTQVSSVLRVIWQLREGGGGHHAAPWVQPWCRGSPCDCSGGARTALQTLPPQKS